MINIQDLEDYDFYHFLADAKREVETLTAFAISLDDEEEFVREFWDSIEEIEFQVETKSAITVRWKRLVRQFSLALFKKLNFNQFNVQIERIREIERTNCSVWGTDAKTVEIVANNHAKQISERLLIWDIKVPKDQKAHVIDVEFNQ